MKIEEKLKEVLNDLCDWIQKETKKPPAVKLKAFYQQ
jgi:hypothetical protein